jgi:uncharacterized protein (DUF302 family)
MITYGFTRETKISFDTVISQLPGELRRKGFEVLASFRIDEEFRKHLGIDAQRYAVISVCNLPLAYRALMREENFGLMIPCNIIVYEKDGVVIVGSIRPTVFMPVADNEFLMEGAKIIERKLAEVLDRIDRIKLPRKQRQEVAREDGVVPIAA